MGIAKKDPDAEYAPAWWHGDEDAYGNAMAAMSNLPRRRR